MYKKKLARLWSTLLVVVLIFVAVVSPTQVVSAAEPSLFAIWKPTYESQRIAGNTRYETAVEVSKATFESAEFVVIASGTSYPDALAGVPLATALNAPILLTTPDVLEPNILAEIERLGVNYVYVLGGEQAVSATVSDKLNARGYTVERLAGANRFETAIAIARELEAVTGIYAQAAYFCSAENFPDALSISTIAAIVKCPILYMQKDGTLDPTTYAYVAEHGKFGIPRRTIIGGPMVIARGAEAYLISEFGATYTTTGAHNYGFTKRIAENNRYNTCLEILEQNEHYFASNTVCFVTGKDFPDALTAGVYAAINRRPLVLVAESAASNIRYYLDNYNPNNVVIIGGESAISEELADSILL